MTEVTKEMYEELLRLDAKAARLVESIEETVSFMRETNRELADGQAETEALKQRLFGDRLKSMAAAE